MPSRSRRRNNKPPEDPHFKKIVHIDDDDGWTHVSRSSTKGTRAIPPEFRDASQNIAEQSISDKPRIETHYSVVELRKYYQRVSHSWLSCPERTALRDHVRQHADAARRIKTSVCLGLGSPSRMFLTMGSLKQLALWLDMLDMINEVTGFTIKAFAQDPVLNDIDKVFLPEHSVTIIDHPAASDHINDGCFVYGPHFSMAYAPREMRTCATPLTICNDVVPFIEGSPWVQDTLPADVDPASAETRKEWQQFLNARDSVPFLGNGNKAFDMQVNDMKVYWLSA